MDRNELHLVEYQLLQVNDVIGAIDAVGFRWSDDLSWTYDSTRLLEMHEKLCELIVDLATTAHTAVQNPLFFIWRETQPRRTLTMHANTLPTSEQT